VRVSNEPAPSSENFEMSWASERGAVAGMQPDEGVRPTGRTQIVRLVVPTPDQEPDRLVLTGDDLDFDNMLLCRCRRASRTVRILYSADDAARDTSGLQYIPPQPPSARRRDARLEFVARRSNEAVGAADLLMPKLVVVTTAPADPEALRSIRGSRRKCPVGRA
jgi:hypothetical protein